MKVLITGGSGFIGTNLQRYFIQHNVKFESVSLRGENKTYINNDISAVVHLAGKAHDLKNTPDENEYYKINTNLTQEIFDEFCKSSAHLFIYLSSVKAVADNPNDIIDEDTNANPMTPYGKSKLAAEHYINKNKVLNKRVFILRPCMVHGPNNKGNLNLLYNVIKKGLPYPFGSFSNQRSYLCVENLCFIINELLSNEEISSGTYMLADDETLSSIDIVKLIGHSLKRHVKILKLPIWLVKLIAELGDLLNLQFNSDSLQKLTESYEVSNMKIKAVIGKQFPISTRNGLMKTFDSFLQLKQ